MKEQIKLPESWAIAQLGELTTVHYGKALAAAHRNVDGKVPVIGSSGFVGFHSEAIVDGPSVVVGRKGAAGSVHLIREPSWPIDTAYFIQPPKELDLAYLAHVLSTLELGQLDKSTAIPSLSRDDLHHVQIALAPFAEQARIVTKLEELLSGLDAGVAELKAAQRKLEQYRQSLLKAAVEGTLTAEWRKQNTPAETGAQLLERILTERRARWEAEQLAKFAAQGKQPPKDWQKKYPEPVKPDTASLPELPKGWVWASVDQLSELITSGSRGWANYYSDAGATFIRSQNINKDWLDLSEIAFVNPPKSSEGIRTRIKKDDVLLTITGANVGKAARVEAELEDAYVSQHVALIRLVDSQLAEVLHLFLTAEAGGRGHLSKEAYGAGKPGLNLQQVAAVLMPLAGAREMDALLKGVTAQLDVAAAIEAEMTKALNKLSAQRQNILRAAFAGQLVPQDPSDEPASVLLERIRAERAANGSACKTRVRKASSGGLLDGYLTKEPKQS